MEKQTKYILFDLDGTLVPLSRARFEPALFQSFDNMFLRQFPDHPEAVAAYKRACMACFRETDTSETNEARLTRLLRQEAGDLAKDILQVLEKHYATDYNEISALIQDMSIADQALVLTEMHGGIPVLATNPISPASCICARLGWIGIQPRRFQLITTWDKCHFVKPDSRYYLEILDMLNAQASDCLMIGNDTDEDMEAAMRAGLHVFLVTDHVMDRRNAIEQYPHGTAEEMLLYLKDYLTQGGQTSWQERN